MRNKIQDNLGALSLQIVNSTAWKFCYGQFLADKKRELGKFPQSKK